MPLFEIDRGSRKARRIDPTTFPDLKLWERQDLEAWVASAPEVAGGEFAVVTAEFDRFDRTSERLDVIGITQTEPGRGRLVVVELKRDGTSTTVDLQAIKYAAYVSAAQLQDVVDMYARHHRVADDDARAALIELLGGSDDDPPVIDNTPRIVLVAGDFRAEVTTTVLWLIDNYEMDIRCVRLQPFIVDDRILVHSELIIPLPEAEQYTLGVQRKRREVEREEEQKARSARLTPPRLVEIGALSVGQQVYFRRDSIPDSAPAWSRDEPLYRATVLAGDGNRTLEWTNPDTGAALQESPSLLAARILHAIGARTGPLSSEGINGMHYWTIDGEQSLRDLAADAGLLEQRTRTIDREALRTLCLSIPAGRWTTYGDIAAAIGLPGAAQSVASAIATDPQIHNAHRILRAPGLIAPGFAADGGGGPEVARERLEREGISFTPRGHADPACRWKPSPPDAHDS